MFPLSCSPSDTHPSLSISFRKSVNTSPELDPPHPVAQPNASQQPVSDASVKTTASPPPNIPMLRRTHSSPDGPSMTATHSHFPVSATSSDRRVSQMSLRGGVTPSITALRTPTGKPISVTSSRNSGAPSPKRGELRSAPTSPRFDTVVSFSMPMICVPLMYERYFLEIPFVYGPGEEAQPRSDSARNAS